MLCSRVIGLCGVLLFVSGCSVYMAASGSYDKDVSVLRIGMPRADVTFHLGTPQAANHHDDGTTTHIFEFEHGNEPSLGRAVGHAVLDVLSFGLWEAIGTPIEASAGETIRLSVTYDENDKVTGFRTLK